MLSVVENLPVTQDHSRSLEMAPFDRSHMNSYFIVTVAVSCIIPEIKRDIDPKSRFCHIPPALDAPGLRRPICSRCRIRTFNYIN